jgi:hypothetical protein
MKTYGSSLEQPVALYDDDGVLYVDNGDRTVTLADDQDGERDIPWLTLETASALHTLACRRYGVAMLCPGDGACAQGERRALLWPDAMRTLLAEMSAR